MDNKTKRHTSMSINNSQKPYFGLSNFPENISKGNYQNFQSRPIGKTEKKEAGLGNKNNNGKEVDGKKLIKRREQSLRK